jgi:hypothetical protein
MHLSGHTGFLHSWDIDQPQGRTEIDLHGHDLREGRRSNCYRPNRQKSRRDNNGGGEELHCCNVKRMTGRKCSEWSGGWEETKSRRTGLFKCGLVRCLHSNRGISLEQYRLAMPITDRGNVSTRKRRRGRIIPQVVCERVSISLKGISFQAVALSAVLPSDAGY